MTHSKRPEDAALFRKVPTEALPLSPAEHREGRMLEKATRTLAEEMAAGLNKAVLAEEAGYPSRGA